MAFKPKMEAGWFFSTGVQAMVCDLPFSYEGVPVVPTQLPQTVLLPKVFCAVSQHAWPRCSQLQNGHGMIMLCREGGKNHSRAKQSSGNV